MQNIFGNYIILKISQNYQTLTLTSIGSYTFTILTITANSQLAESTILQQQHLINFTRNGISYSIHIILPVIWKSSPMLSDTSQVCNRLGICMPDLIS